MVLKQKNAPAALSDKEKGDNIETQMQTMRIKQYIAREQKVKSNMDKLYGVVIGQCSNSLLSVLNNNIEYITKDEKCDISWILEKNKDNRIGS